MQRVSPAPMHNGIAEQAKGGARYYASKQERSPVVANQLAVSAILKCIDKSKVNLQKHATYVQACPDQRYGREGIGDPYQRYRQRQVSLECDRGQHGQ